MIKGNLYDMKISACYITKNESANIAVSIESIAASVDEIIVYDTGSEDDTCRIAEALPKVKLFRSAWCDDFAAARNAALSHATGDWVVFLDADEYFSEETRGNVRAVLEKARGYDALAVKIVNLDVDGAKEKRLNHTYVVRAFRRSSKIRYAGRIHEHIEREDGALHLGFIPEESLVLLHTGYTASRAKGKAERNLRLLLQELEQTQSPEELYRYLAEAYEGVGDTERALHYARLDIADGPRPVLFASRCYRMLLYTLPEGEECTRVLEKARRDFPRIPEFHAEYAEHLARQMQFPEAIAAMEEAFRAYAEHEEDGEAMEFDDAILAVAKERAALWQKITEREKSLKISACAIVRDESHDMPRWLENTAVYSDERIVVDTGSKDDTKALAEAAGARVYDYMWRDDFAAAKNEALSHATGDWVAFLDADEYFAEPKAVRPYLAALSVEQPEIEAVMLTIANLDEDDHFKEIQRFPTVRLFRRRADIAFFGRIHEAVGKEEGRLEIKLERKHLLVCHLGYSSGRVRKKIERNFALLQEDIEKNGEQPGHYRYLADCYAAFGDWKKALYYALSALDSPATAIGSDSDMYRTALQAMRECRMGAEDMLALTEKALEAFPEIPDFYAEKGMILSSMGRLKDAADSFEQAFSSAVQEAESTWQASRFAADAPVAWRRLGEIYLALGETEKAKAALVASLRLHPFSVEALAAWQRLMGVSCGETLREFFPHTAEALRFLVRWAASAGEAKLAADAAGELAALFGERLPETDCLAAWQAGDWQKMAGLATREVADTMQELFLTLLQLLEQRETEPLPVQEMQPLLPALQEIVRCYAKEEPLAEELWESYRAFLPALAQRLPQEALLRYVRLLSKLSPEKKREAAALLLAAEQWRASLELLAAVPADAAAADASFWHDAGVVFYQLGDFAAARDSFSHARQKGCSLKDIDAYEAWMKEALA